MKFLFVYPNAGRLKAFQIGIGVLSSVLKQHGHDVKLFDVTFVPEGEEEDTFEKEVLEYKPDMIGFSIRTVDYQLSKRLRSRIEKLGIPTVAGGPHPTLASKETAEVFGLALVGEAESALPELLDRIESGKSIEDVPNLCMKKEDGTFIENPLMPLFHDLDALPFPDWGLFDERHFYESTFLPYAKPGSKCLYNIEKSRGCPYKCSYCSMPTIRRMYKGLGVWHREKSPERLVDEILAFKSNHPSLDFIHFIDDIFLLPLSKMKKLTKLFKEKINISFSTSERPERMTPELVKLFKEAGGYQLWIGVESGDEKLRVDLLKRDMSDDSIVKAFKLAKEYGINSRSATMVGLPGQDDDSYVRTYDLIGRLGAKSVQYSIFYPFIGTELYDYCIEKGYYKKKEFMEKSFYEGSPLELPNFPARKIMRYQKLLYHMQGDFSLFKRWIVKWGGRSEVIFTLVFCFYMGPRILLKNKNWIRDSGVWNTLKRIAGYYRKL